MVVRGDGRIGIGTSTPQGVFDVKSVADNPTIGSTELSSGYSGTNWTGSGLTWTHTTGSTAALTATVTNNATGGYRVIMTITGRTAGTVTVTLKGDPVTSTISATSTLYFNYFTTAGLTITPTSDFDGTIT
jgi:PKD repeat protein